MIKTPSHRIASTMGWNVEGTGRLINGFQTDGVLANDSAALG
jgi:hypothetical protein